ncbi:MAG: DNA-directed RNA polymerase subunit omega [Candidatus Aminicenantaceae bacterium]
MKTYGDIDSKFRFVILAAKRAKQLLRGAKPLIKTKSKNPIRIAQNEVTDGLVNYEIIQPEKEKIIEQEEAFIGEEVMEEADEIEEIEAEEKKPEKEKVSEELEVNSEEEIEEEAEEAPEEETEEDEELADEKEE